MARPSYGEEVKARVKRLFEALLAYVNDEYEEGNKISIQFTRQNETQIAIRGKRRCLEELTLKDKYEGKLTDAQVREALKRLEDFLGILEDNRSATQGSEEWHFTLKLWHKDKAENLRQFDIEWEAKRPEKSKQAAAKLSPPPINPPTVNLSTATPLNNLGQKGIVNPEEFIGREEELDKIRELLQQGSRVASSAISGMGGVGKTELALQYARRHLDDYPGGVYWFSAKAGDVKAQWVEFAIAYFPNFAIPDQLDTLIRKVEYCFQQCPPGNVLVIFDDVSDYNAVKDCVDVMPPRFKVLLTTRLQLGAKVQTLTLDVLTPDQAMALLTLLVGDGRIQQQLGEAEKMCAWLGYLPLGLELVGRYLRRKPDLSLAEMLRRLEEKRLQQPALQKPKSEADMTASLGVQAAIDLSWQELDEAAKQLACLLGVFAPTAIPWWLVEKCLPLADTEELEETRDESLVNLHLLERTEKGIYRLHPLIREYCRLKLEEFAQVESCQGKAEGLKQAFVTALVDVAKQIPQQIITREEVASLSPAIPHLEAGASHLSDYVEDEDVTEPFLGLGWFYQGQALYEPAEVWKKQCVVVAEHRLGSEHPDLATGLSNLANLYYAQGRYSEAEPLYLQVGEIDRQSLPDNHPDLATHLNNLANLYYAQGRYSEAEPLYLQALEIDRRRSLPENHPGLAPHLNNLALLYESQGRYSEAEPLYLQALEIVRQSLPDNHPDLATHLNNLANLYREQGRYSEAEPLYLQALEIVRQSLPDNHPDLATHLNNLAGLYYAQRRYSEAELLFRQALEIVRRSLPDNHPALATQLNNLAFLYESQGRYSEAEPLYQQALEILESQLGLEHPYTINARKNFEYLKGLQH
ncbi:tetratricopeptide repeat protein [Microcoleus sp. FACHB-68]|uniref:tetratricopeptide repeat protein n=1 Tax=Microcoleus sp. FACHB-68 TaxID=2692826 RepID=UPI0016862EE9|nr:tetratricopeptide repeat protein [Microcoleus sp. FACHB-68]MBD1936447.1 tetratricopeptide repeat protein [Microcoleus sp. FACHB-68]